MFSIVLTRVIATLPRLHTCSVVPVRLGDRVGGCLFPWLWVWVVVSFVRACLWTRLCLNLVNVVKIRNISCLFEEAALTALRREWNFMLCLDRTRSRLTRRWTE